MKIHNLIGRTNKTDILRKLQPHNVNMTLEKSQIRFHGMKSDFTKKKYKASKASKASKKTIHQVK
jgi:hypothetical protein